MTASDPSQTLTTLSLAYNAFADMLTVKLVARALILGNSLVDVNINGNSIGDAGGQFLLEALADTRRLKRLVVSPFMKHDIFVRLVDMFPSVEVCWDGRIGIPVAFFKSMLGLWLTICSWVDMIVWRTRIDRSFESCVWRVCPPEKVGCQEEKGDCRKEKEEMMRSPLLIVQFLVAYIVNVILIAWTVGHSVSTYLTVRHG